MKTLKAEWQSFSKCLPPDASEGQRHDMEAAFYSGARALHNLLLTSVTPGDEVEDADIQMMERVEKEFDEFADLLNVRASMRK